MSQFQPYIEYHFKTKPPLTRDWHESYEQYKVGTAWDVVRKAWPDGWDFVPGNLAWPKYVWPGGYGLYYVTKDCGVLCPDCANKELPRTLDPDDDQFFIVGQDANWEDPHMYCDHCNKRIPSAYAEDEEHDDADE